MPFCPNCRYEYSEGADKCFECGSKLVAELSPEPARALPDEPLVKVFTAEHIIEAQTVRGVLDAEGIPCRRRHDPDRFLLGVGRFLPIDILVPESKAQEARDAIKAAMEAGSDLPEEM
jgi:hypothetical protein